MLDDINLPGRYRPQSERTRRPTIADDIAFAEAWRAEAPQPQEKEKPVTAQLTPTEYQALNRDDRRRAREDGRANQILGAPVAPEGHGPISAAEYAGLTRDDRRRMRQAGRVDHLLTDR